MEKSPCCEMQSFGKYFHPQQTRNCKCSPLNCHPHNKINLATTEWDTKYPSVEKSYRPEPNWQKQNQGSIFVRNLEIQNAFDPRDAFSSCNPVSV